MDFSDRDGRYIDMSTKEKRKELKTEVERHIDEIHRFMPGACRITVIARWPRSKEPDLIMSNDEIGKALTALGTFRRVKP